MEPKVWTIAEANGLLPEVRRLTHIIVSVRAEVLAARPQLWEALRRAVYNGGGKSLPAAERQIGTIQQAVTLLKALGVEIKDLDTGLIDFPARRQGEAVLLCWQYDEPEVAWWHDEATGYSGRQPIDWID
ncbi:MAG: DUF2203 domain-containing protein [Herpetosiphon sp.]